MLTKNHISPVLSRLVPALASANEPASEISTKNLKLLLWKTKILLVIKANVIAKISESVLEIIVSKLPLKICERITFAKSQYETKLTRNVKTPQVEKAISFLYLLKNLISALL